jgi:hypothetical protein
MKIVYSFNEFKAAIKAGEKDILLKGCGKKLLCAFAAASVCIGMGISSTAGVIASAGVIGVAAAPATGGIGPVIIIACAATIVAIVALCKNYNIEVDWKSGEVHVKIKK